MKAHRLGGGGVRSAQGTIVEDFSRIFSSHSLALAETQQKEKPEGDGPQQPLGTSSSDN